MTTHNDMIYYLGGIPVSAGIGRLVQLFEGDNIWFVDGMNGSASNAGNKPDAAVDHISAAEDLASAFGTIYVKPMQYTTRATQTNYYYTDNITVDVSKPGLVITGAGPGGSHYMTTEVKTATASAHVFTINAPGVQIENMRLTGTSQTSGDYSIIRAESNASTSNGAAGLGIRNVTFSNAKIGGAIRLDNAWNVTIDNCIFHNCAFGVYGLSTVSSTNGLWIKYCQFEGQPANIDADIYLTGGSANCYGGLVHGCTFQGTVPALSAGTIKRYISVGNTWTTGAGGLISDCNFGFDCETLTGLVGAAGTQILIPATWEIVHCYAFAQTTGEGIITKN